MISLARLDTKKQCSTEPQWTGIRASGASLTAHYDSWNPGDTALMPRRTRQVHLQRNCDGRRG
jgi:hypothetical protein